MTSDLNFDTINKSAAAIFEASKNLEIEYNRKIENLQLSLTNKDHEIKRITDKYTRELSLADWKLKDKDDKITNKEKEIVTLTEALEECKNDNKVLEYKVKNSSNLFILSIIF